MTIVGAGGAATAIEIQAAFELWTGQPMPIPHMKEVLDIHYN